MYVKIFGSMLDSSIWSESHATRIVWITMLAMADADGFVWASLSGLKRRANVTREELSEALKILSSPDPESKTPDHDGRRILVVDGGWEVTNFKKYREFRTARQMRDAARKRAERYRNSEKTPKICGHVTRDTDTSQQAEAEEESEESLVELPFGSSTRSLKRRLSDQDVVDLYNREAVGTGLPAGRKSPRLSARLRVSLRKHPDPEFWVKHFRAARSTPFLRGDTGRTRSDGTRWRASLPWLALASNIEKCLGGEIAGYDASAVVGPTGQGPPEDEAVRQERNFQAYLKAKRDGKLAR